MREGNETAEACHGPPRRTLAQPPDARRHTQDAKPLNAELFDGRDSSGRPVWVSLSGRMLHILSEEGHALDQWSVDQLVRTDPGVQAKATFLPRGVAAKLVIDDAALLEVLFAVRPALRHGQHRTGGAYWKRALVGAGLGIAGLFLLIDKAPSLMAHAVPLWAERIWSDGIQAGMEPGVRHCTRPDGTAALKDLFARLATAGNTAPPRFVVLDKADANAFTLPDGRIVILGGLINQVGDADELAGVLAHEMGHVLHGDPTREALRGATLALIADTVGWGASVAGQMTRLSYSRQAEAAADASALQTLRRAGLRADGLGRFFAAMQARHEGDQPSFLSDHPSNADRMKAVQADHAGNPALTAGQWQAVQDICRR